MVRNQALVFTGRFSAQGTNVNSHLIASTCKSTRMKQGLQLLTITFDSVSRVSICSPSIHIPSLGLSDDLAVHRRTQLLKSSSKKLLYIVLAEFSHW